MSNFAITAATWLAIGYGLYLLVCVVGPALAVFGINLLIWGVEIPKTIAKHSADIAGAVCGAVKTSVALAYEAVATALVWSTVPPFKWLSTKALKARQRMYLFRLYQKADRVAYPSFADFVKAMADDEDLKAFGTKRDQTKPRKPDTAYEWALKVMGLESEAELTLPKLKQRYRQMMSLVHPDKQFPNQVFAQQINDAMEMIKREHGWA